MSVGTVRPWPADAYPTAEQLAGWLLACTDAERLRWCELNLPVIQRGHRCADLSHDCRVTHLEQRVGELVAQRDYDAERAVTIDADEGADLREQVRNRTTGRVGGAHA